MQYVEEREYQIDSYLSDILSGQLISATIRIPANELEAFAKTYPNLLFYVRQTYKHDGHDVHITEVSKQ